MNTLYKQPPISQLRNIKFPEIESFKAPNGLTIHLNPAGETDVVKLDLLINAGRPQERKHMVSRAVGNLITRGTGQKDRDDIDELIDQKGAILYSTAEPDLIHISLLTIARHVERLFPLVLEMLTDPAFHEVELIKFIKRNKLKLREDLHSPSVRAYRHTTEHVFGKDHPYGYNSNKRYFDSLRSEDLVLFYLDNFFPANTHLILTARGEDRMVQILMEGFGQWKSAGNEKSDWNIPPPVNETGNSYIEFQAANKQMAFCMARTGPGREDPSYVEGQMLSLALGGYFGSRLMKNIREEKGLAYDIHSTLDPLRFATLFMVAGECNRKAADEVKKEIAREMTVLREELIGDREMEMLKNYTMGVIMNTLDGPLHTSDWIRSYIAESGSPRDLRYFSEKVLDIKSRDLRELARDFLREDQFFCTWVS